MENTTRSDAILPSDVPKAPVTVLLLNLFFVCVGKNGHAIGQWTFVKRHL
ncbi:MAG TPA: hypothetical protein VEW48_09875 [Thermoanaerobaculia bacterium]|nr:hypothetical protein [Thermoanaerobaculia bacterium]